MFIHWDDKLLLGNALIDQQHRMLLLLCRRLDIAIKTEQSTDTIRSITIELRKFTEFHFFSEENLMREIGYPELDQHSNIHTDLLMQLNQMIARFHRQEYSPADTLFFLYQWLLGPVVEEDFKIGKFARHSLNQPIGENYYELFFKAHYPQHGYE